MVDLFGMCVGEFDAAKDVISQPRRVRQRVQREGMFLGAWHVEVLSARSAAHDQVVEGKSFAVLEVDDAAIVVD